MVWQFAEARDSLNDVFTRAIQEGSQFVMRGDEEVVALSKKDYLELIGEKPDFIQHILNFPNGDYLNLARDRYPMCEFEW
jgi:hypothetical protein